MHGKHLVAGPKSVPRDAAEWCARLHSEQVTPSDRAAFQEWLAEAPGNWADYEHSHKLMRLSRGLAAYPGLDAALGLDVAAPVVAKKGIAFRPALMAASLAAVLLAGGMVTWWQNRVIDYVTMVGERKTVTLKDGSTVDLNTDTEMDVAFGGGERQLSLKKGEAFFEVFPDATRPFVIETRQGEIRVVGTKFNVRVENGETIVTVLEGHVRVAGATTGGKRVFTDLLADDQMNFDARGRGQKRSGADLAQVAAWRHGQIYFDNATLAEVVGEFNRYNQRKYALENADLAALKLSGVFRAGDARALLYVLRESFGIEVREQTASAVVLGLRDAKRAGQGIRAGT